MMRRFCTLAFVVLVFAGWSDAASARLDVWVDVAPPIPRPEVVPPPRYGYVWAPGYWAWRNRRHVWIGGHWLRAHRGRWIPDHWEAHGTRYHFIPGHWQR
jgi:hypothetical protein